MRELRFERRVQAPPGAVWPLIADVERMRRWARIPMRRVEPGDGGAPGAIGELREVTLPWPGRTLRLEEVVEWAEPPSLLVYRVVGGAPLRRHRGEVRLSAEGGGTRLTWDVAFEASLPGLAAIAARLLEAQLGARLDDLVTLLRGAPDEPAPPWNALDERELLPSLYAEAEAIRDRQRALADELDRADDPKRYFSRVYQYVTENQIGACRAGGPRHPAWVLRLIPRFHDYYEGNLRRWREGAGGVEAHWRSAFGAMEQARRWRRGNAFEGALYGLAKGVQAHIEEDLPRTLAEVWFRHYRGRCDYGRFRADYAAMANVFREASARLGPSLPRAGAPWWLGLAGAALPEAAREALRARRFYDVPRERRRAFQRGERIARMLVDAAPG